MVLTKEELSIPALSVQTYSVVVVELRWGNVSFFFGFHSGS